MAELKNKLITLQGLDYFNKNVAAPHQSSITMLAEAMSLISQWVTDAEGKLEAVKSIQSSITTIYTAIQNLEENALPVDTALSDSSENPVQNKAIKEYTDTKAAQKQDKLVSGTNLKTVNNESLLGAGNIVAGMSIEVGAEKWYGTYTNENGVTYQVYTKTVYIPALPDTAGVTTYPHGVTNIKQILGVYGFTTDGFVLNAPRQTTADNIAIYQVQKSTTGGIAIEVGKNRSAKQAYVVMIYAKNN